MEREYVSSSMIKSIGFDNTTCTLEIEFTSNGQVWQYFDVPESIYQEFRVAPSLGKYFHANIRNHYPESRVG